MNEFTLLGLIAIIGFGSTFLGAYAYDYWKARQIEKARAAMRALVEDINRASELYGSEKQASRSDEVK